MNQYATLVATNPFDMPTTREHDSVYSDDEDAPYALPREEEEDEDLLRSLIWISSGGILKQVTIMSLVLITNLADRP